MHMYVVTLHVAAVVCPNASRGRGRGRHRQWF